MKTSVIIGIVIVALLLVGGIYWSMQEKTYFKNDDKSTIKESPGSVGSGTTATVSIQEKVINIKASRFLYDPGTITVKKGDKVKMVIDNADTTHGIVIPNLSISGIGSVEFTADRVGTFEFKCPTMCGSGHKDMKGTLVVEE